MVIGSMAIYFSGSQQVSMPPRQKLVKLLLDDEISLLKKWGNSETKGNQPIKNAGLVDF